MNTKRTVVAISADKHSGSSLGLMMPKPFQLHDGGTYSPSPAQQILWEQHEECLEFIKEQRKRSRLIWVENGDPCEGIHHGTTQTISSRVEELEQIGVDILDYSFKKVRFGNDDLAYMIAGTEEHGGSGSQSENRIAEDLDCFVPQFTESSGRAHRFTWDRLLLKVNGVLLDIAHHGGTVGSRAWTKQNGMRHTLMSFYFQSLEDKTDIPRYWVRSHKHEYIHAFYEGKQGIIDGFVTPSFQFKTGFAYKVAGHRLSDIGMIVIVIEEDGSCKHYPIMASYKQDKIQIV